MRVVALTAPAEGAGRTTLAGWLGWRAEQAAAGPVVLLDADAVGDLSRWAEARKPQHQVSARWDDSCTASGFRQLAEAGIGLVLVDCPGPDDGTRLDEVLAVADLAAILVRPTEDDLSSVGGLVDRVEAAGKRFVFVVNQAPEMGDMTAATAVALAQHGPVSPVILPERPGLGLDGVGDPAAVASGDDEADCDFAHLWDYLSGRLARLAPAVSLEPAAAADDRRRYPRHDYEQAATYTWEGQVLPCLVRDISAGGISFRSENRPPLGARVTLQVPYLGQFDAEVVRDTGEAVGLSFVVDENQRTQLVDRLSNLIGAGRQSALPATPAEPPAELFARKKRPA
jgi:hypothetical protein